MRLHREDSSGFRQLQRVMYMYLAVIFFSLFRGDAGSSDVSHSNGMEEKCSPLSNIAIFSATGRVGTTNMLTMLAYHSNVVNVGEIFMSSSFKSANLPPNNMSPKQHPASVAMQNHLVSRIKSTLRRNRDGHSRMLASIKFWHAWSNGVTVKWLARQLIYHGCVSHFLLIARNPVRITISEMYGHKFKAWSYRGDSVKDVQTGVCARSRMAYHVGARWAGEMAVAHYLDFQEILSLSGAEGVRSLGLMYEVDILPSAHKAFERVSAFLAAPIENWSMSPRTAKKGMLCPLSAMLVNYEELKCSLRRWERNHGVSIGANLSDAEGAGELGLSWMASDWDDEVRPTFSRVMAAWKRLADADAPISECSLRDMLDPSNEDPLPRQYQVQSSRRKNGAGLCGEGGRTEHCKVPMCALCSVNSTYMCSLYTLECVRGKYVLLIMLIVSLVNDIVFFLGGSSDSLQQ